MARGSLKKYEVLIDALQSYGGAAVAFSGGVDSTLLLYAACQAIGQQKVFVLRGISELLSERERKDGSTLLNALGIDPGMRLEVELHPLEWSEFVINDAERCYVCKKRMYQCFLTEMEKKDCPALLDGTNADDLHGERPGFRAIGELGVKTPLLDAGLTKEDIRFLARSLNLSNHNKPSNSCLATRFPENAPLDRDELKLVERCESFLLDYGFSGCRVRPGPAGKVVLQVTDEGMKRLAASHYRQKVTEFLHSVGFDRVLVDLQIRS